MGRRKGRDLDGWLVLDKPLGPTSTHFVNQLRWYYDARKVGHGGTLDPLASGVLPIAFGRATATIPWIMDSTKIYRFTLALGQSRSTDDLEGDVTATSEVRPDDATLRQVAQGFVGNPVLQVPPVYSALRVGGQRSYDLARAGKAPDLPPRPVRIDSVTLVARPDADHAVFEVQSGKGVYVRSLARDIALACGTVGHVSALRRLRCGPFTLGEALTPAQLKLDKAEENRENAKVLPAPLMAAATALADIPALAVTREEGRALVCGQRLASLAGGNDVFHQPEGLLWRVVLEGHVLGVARVEQGVLRAARMIEDQHFFGDT
ncbi:tRNA pseudouridine(55) synthase TruB [Formicincola oecophyllae]|uniref:tRNA pseudouridine synthase B n=1 Tax=Formicincola oecophyllae TaxID=2558361 RepID=A0A4Y6UD50_9PROT|nr:tRNA pseudouridine(55) synthase TruB [Formicincola oecophyllae]QDH14416.1 tRNA pseudouridine(55) synthase TruB [Formicincola oecophyllae]